MGSGVVIEVGLGAGFPFGAAGVLGIFGVRVAFGVGPEGAGVAGVAGVAVGAGVEGAGAGTVVSAFGFGFNLVIKNENFAPWLAFSHSMKLYEGK